MVNILQPADLNASDFTNSGGVGTGGVRVKKSGLNTVGAGAPVAPPGPHDPLIYINTSTVPHSMWHYAGGAWHYLGDGSGSGATNLGYTPAAGGGTVTSSTGTGASLPLANGVNAGLAPPTNGNATHYLNGQGAYVPLPPSGSMVWIGSQFLGGQAFVDFTGFPATGVKELVVAFDAVSTDTTNSIASIQLGIPGTGMAPAGTYRSAAFDRGSNDGFVFGGYNTGDAAYGHYTLHKVDVANGVWIGSGSCRNLANTTVAAGGKLGFIGEIDRVRVAVDGPGLFGAGTHGGGWVSVGYRL